MKKHLGLIGVALLFVAAGVAWRPLAAEEPARAQPAVGRYQYLALGNYGGVFDTATGRTYTIMNMAEGPNKWVLTHTVSDPVEGTITSKPARTIVPEQPR